MKQLFSVFLIGSALLSNPTAFAQDNLENEMRNFAVNITVGSKKGSVDSAALRSIRKLVGDAIAAGTVDIFYIYYPRAGGATSTEFGLSACTEAGFNSAPEKFKRFVDQVRSVRHEAQTFLNVEWMERCRDFKPIEPLDCGGVLGTLCPGGQYCSLSMGRCKVAGAQGSCEVIPEACNAEYNPVCGCDGKTYGNACEAARAGVSLDHYGQCKPPEELVCDKNRDDNCNKSEKIP
ncbi:MAG TPA: Kazal-type serine protease inhibitor family protein [Nitrosospira sp.]